MIQTIFLNYCRRLTSLFAPIMYQLKTADRERLSQKFVFPAKAGIQQRSTSQTIKNCLPTASGGVPNTPVMGQPREVRRAQQSRMIPGQNNGPRLTSYRYPVPRLVLSGVLLLIVGLLVPQSVFAECDAEETLARLEESYRRRGAVEFTYQQVTTSSIFGTTEKQKGHVWLNPAGSFRVETPGETFVGRGDTLWHYVPVHKQVTRRVLDSTSSGGWPTDFLWDLRRDFMPVDCRIDTVEKKPLLRVRTVAKTSTAAIQQLTVWLVPEQLIVRRAEYIDYNDDQVVLVLGKLKKDKVDPQKRFTLQLPDSVEVVTMPQKKLQQNSSGRR